MLLRLGETIGKACGISQTNTTRLVFYGLQHFGFQSYTRHCHLKFAKNNQKKLSKFNFSQFRFPLDQSAVLWIHARANAKMIARRLFNLIRVTASVLVLFSNLSPDGVFAADTNFSARFILDMVQNNPGEPPQPTAFRDPQRLAGWGFNGQVIKAQADSCETFDAIAPGVLPKDSEARRWIEQHAQALELKAQQAHAVSLKAYAWFQFIVLPRALVAKFKDEI